MISTNNPSKWVSIRNSFVMSIFLLLIHKCMPQTILIGSGKLRNLLLMIPVALVTGCSTVGADRVAKPKTIAPISLMGNTLSIRLTGPTFKDEHREIDVSQWDIDQYTENTAAQLIRDGQKFRVVNIERVNGLEKSIKFKSWSWTNGPTLQGGSGSIRNLAKNVGADYILVIAPYSRMDPFLQTSEYLSGYGIYQNSTLEMKRAINYVMAGIILFDGSTGDEVAKTKVPISLPRSAADWMEGDKLALIENNAKYSKSAIKQLIENMLNIDLIQLRIVK